MLRIVSRAELILAFGAALAAATTEKTPILNNSHVLIPLNTADAAASNAFVYQAEITNAPTDTGAAWAIGDTIYWDNTNHVFTKTSTSNTKCGYALEAKASGDAVSGLIAFNSFA
jgi:predicted RecA/RadA family phage recombinase